MVFIFEMNAFEILVSQYEYMKISGFTSKARKRNVRITDEEWKESVISL
jgi:hypothetical protein